jgi:hypothetical protein
MNLGERIMAIQRQRADLIDELQTLHTAAVAANRHMTPAEQTAFESKKRSAEAMSETLDALRQEEHANAATAVPIVAGSGIGAATVPKGQRIDVAPLHKALVSSGNWTAGAIELKSVIQGGGAGNLGGIRSHGTGVALDGYGAVPLVLAVQTIGVDSATQYFFNRLKPTTAPATGGKQATEGALKTRVLLEGEPVVLDLPFYTAWEKVSVQALSDQNGLLESMESILRGAVLRAADADAWTAFVAQCTAITPSADGVSTIVTTAARVAAAGGTAVRAVLNPMDYAAMMLTRVDAGSGEWLGVPPGVVLPTIVQSSGVPEGSLLVTAGVDGAFSAIRQAVGTAVGLDGDDFTRNLRTVLLEGRMNFGVRDPGLAYAGALESA